MTTSSSVDVSFPPDNVRVSKSTARTQQTVIRDELNVLFKSTNYARRNIAFEWRNL